MFIATLFIIAKNWKQIQVFQSHNEILLSNKKELFRPATWLYLRFITLSESSLFQKTTSVWFSLYDILQKEKQ